MTDVKFYECDKCHYIYAYENQGHECFNCGVILTEKEEREDLNRLPKINPEYGGELLTKELVDSLELGTKLRVTNGCWDMRICGSKSQKKLFLEYNGETFDVYESIVESELWVEVID